MSIEVTIDPSLLDKPPSFIANQVFSTIRSQAIVVDGDSSKTPGNAKNIDEVTDLVQAVIENEEAVRGTPDDRKVIFGREMLPEYFRNEVITYAIEKREPGKFDQGRPFEGKVKNLRPILREEVEDPDNPGYRLLVLGYWYDNLVRFTCWGRTHKVVDARALWFEKIMSSYMWFFRYEGVGRFLYWGRGEEITLDLPEHGKVYGRQLDFYVKTEEITQLSQKTLEQLVLTYDSTL